MTRVRTHKKHYTTISNATAQSDEITPQALGILVRCLSMPENWDFNVKTMWKKGCQLSRNKLYAVFNELIELGHCIRVISPNKMKPNIRGELSYEIFDDVEDCKKRCDELSKDESVHSFECSSRFGMPEFKKSRVPQNRESDRRDPTSRDAIKEIYKKETLEKEDSSCSPPSKFKSSPPPPSSKPQRQTPSAEEDEKSQKIKLLQELPFTESQRQRLMKHSIVELRRAVSVFRSIKPKSSPMGLMLNILENPEKYDDSPQFISENKQREANSVCEIATQMVNDAVLLEGYDLIPYDDRVEFRYPGRRVTPVAYTDSNVLSYIKEFIDNYSVE